MDRKTIGEVFNKYKTDKGPWRHGYNYCYSKVFEDFTPTTMLEIGIFEGRSLAAWRELFPHADIHGLDNFKREEKMVYTPENVKIITGDSRDTPFVKSLPYTYDIIIDDGNHHPNVQWQTFLNFSDKWTKYYVIEDVCNENNEEQLRRRLKAFGIKNITTFRSRFRGNVRINGEMVNCSFFAVVIRRE